MGVRSGVQRDLARRAPGTLCRLLGLAPALLRREARALAYLSFRSPPRRVACFALGGLRSHPTSSSTRTSNTPALGLRASAASTAPSAFPSSSATTGAPRCQRPHLSHFRPLLQLEANLFLQLNSSASARRSTEHPLAVLEVATPRRNLDWAKLITGVRHREPPLLACLRPRWPRSLLPKCLATPAAGHP